MSDKEERKEFIRTVRKRSWDTAFKKGILSWLSLGTVGFIFAFTGASNASEVSFINVTDTLLGLENELLPNNTEIVVDFIHRFSASNKWTFLDSESARILIENLTRTQTWLIRILGANVAYVKRNPLEVIFWLILAAVMSFVIRYFLQNIFLQGQYRFAMENRFDREVSVLRIFAPFHRENLLNTLKVKFMYRMTLLLWNLTIIGGIYKGYQYMMVPYLLAEDPQISWKDARDMSRKMTDGHKMDIFLTELSYIYMFLLGAVPVAGLLFWVPLKTQLGAEFYFFLRERTEDRRFFTEKAFDKPCYTEDSSDHVPYLMKDVIIESPEEIIRESGYTVRDYIFMYFVFCFIGWIWEVSLHLVQYQEFVNRGTMYGPWLPIYGNGGVLMILLLSRFKKNKQKLFVLMILLCGALEYGSSLYLDFIYNKSYWDYKEMFLNLNGRICLAGLLAFALGGFFGIYIAGPKLRSLMHKLTKKKQIILCAVLIAFFAADSVCCAVFGFNGGSGVGESLNAVLRCFIS